MLRPHQTSTLFPYTTLFRSDKVDGSVIQDAIESTYFAFRKRLRNVKQATSCECSACSEMQQLDRKSTRLNSSHVSISYAVFCLKKKKREGYRDCEIRMVNDG